MCGIAGFYGNLDEQALLRMTRALAHRGPDGEGHEILPGLREPDKVGLGHRRLSLIDLTGGAQPMWSTDRIARQPAEGSYLDSNRAPTIVGACSIQLPLAHLQREPK
jgi:asparagine synthetase B (glutamine-hydrolysing)